MGIGGLNRATVRWPRNGRFSGGNSFDNRSSMARASAGRLPSGSLNPTHMTRARVGPGNTPIPARNSWKGRIVEAASRHASPTQSRSRGHVRPMNFTVTCQFSGGTHRPFGYRSRHGSMAADAASLTRSGMSTAANRRSGLASGRDARSRAMSEGQEIPAEEVEGGLLRPSPDLLAVARGPEGAGLVGVVRGQGYPY